MASQTLKELKAENAGAEAAIEDVVVEDKKEPIQDEYVEVVEEVKADDTGGESKNEDEQEVTLESWQLTEETGTSEDEQKGGFVPNHEAAKRRKKNQALRGELKEKDSELDELRKQVEALQSGVAPKVEQEQAALVRPTREQFDYDDDAYDNAVDKYYDDKLDRKIDSRTIAGTEKANQVNQQQAFADAQQKSLDAHYGMAQKLVDDGKVTQESFKNADTLVRQALDSINPGQGDNLTNTFISMLNSAGEGSEKVMYQLGVNPAKLQELQNKIITDPSGLSASVFLGQLQANVQTPSKRRSQAPTPGSKVEGEGGNNGNVSTLQKQYNKLDDIQSRISFKRKAKKNGTDTKNW